MIDFDTMLVHVGEFGLYQKLLFIFQAPFCIFVTFVTFGQLFMQIYPMEFWCGDHFLCPSNMTPGQRQNFSFPFDVMRGAINPCILNDFDNDAIRRPGDNVSEVIWRKVDETSRRCGSRPLPSVPSTAGQRNRQPPQPPPCFVEESQSSTLSRSKRQYYGGGGRRTTVAYYPNTNVPDQNPNFPNQNPNFPNQNPNFPNQNPNFPNQGGYNPSQNYQPQPVWPNNPNYGGGQFGRPPQYTTQPPTTPNYGFTRPPPRIPNPNVPNGQSQGNPGGPSRPRPNEQRTTTQAPLINNEQEPQSEFQRDDDKWKTCRIVPEPNLVHLPNQAQVNLNTTRVTRNTPVEKCRNISFDPISSHTRYPTIVTEGMWWCNAETYVVASQAVFFLGAIVGGFLIGYIADNFGRVPALVLSNVIGAIGGALSVTTTNFWLFSFFRFITGMAFDNCFVMMYILVLEFCGAKYRTLVANLSIAIFYTVGTLLLPWLALWLNHWRIFGLVISLPMLLGLFAWFIVPESARWLLSKGKATQATNILRTFAKRNRKNVSEEIFVEFEQGAKQIYDEFLSKEEEPSLTEAFKTPRLRKTFILLVLIWSMIALVYDGHNRNILNLANSQFDVYLMFTIASATELPADLLLIVTLDRFGRRWLAFGSMCLSGVCSLIAATLPEARNINDWYVILAMAMASRFFVNVSFNIGLQYASELLPTVIRAQGVNIIHIMGYVASIISPFVAQIGRTNPTLSLILLGGFAIFGGVLSLFLAETLNEELPNTLEEAEAFGKHQSFWNCPLCAPPKPEEEMPMEPTPSAVRLRNSMRPSSRGETYRSSIISAGRRYQNEGIMLNPGTSGDTGTKLRRVYTR